MSVLVVRGKIIGQLKMQDFNGPEEFEGMVIHLETEADGKPRVKCLEGVRIRSTPDANYTGNIVGKLATGTITEGLEERQIGEDYWVRIGYQQWCARKYRGVEYLEWVS